MAGEMVGNEEIPEGKIPIPKTKNDEQLVINKDRKFQVDLNESRNNNNNSFELLQTVTDLKAEPQSVIEENERILKAQEELNLMLMSKIIEKPKEHESDEGTITCKRKKKKLDFSDSESNSSSDKNTEDTDSSENCDMKPKKKKYKPYEEILGEFKKIKPPVFNGEEA